MSKKTGSMLSNQPFMSRVGARVRNKAFYALDRLRGGELRKALDQFSRYQHLAPDDPTLVEYQDRRVRLLLEHARTTVPYYSQLEATSLEQFPVVDKVLIRSEYEQFLSADPKIGVKRTMKTSGSTGTPFAVPQNAEKVTRVQAELVYFLGAVGFSVGDMSLILPPASPRDLRSKLSEFVANQPRLASWGVSAKEGEKVFAEIVKRKPGVVRGIPSIFEALETYIVSGHPDTRPQLTSLVSSGSMLPDRTRERLSEYFNCRMVSRYSNQEQGVLAQDTHDDNVFEINQTNYLIEVLKQDSDDPAELGEVGRIVVTDLYNRALPLIRYDTGDLAAYDERLVQGQKRAVLVDLAGRMYDQITDCGGNQVLQGSLINVLWHELPDVLQIQIVQKAECTYLFNLNGQANQEQMTRALKSAREMLGGDAEIEVVFLDELPVYSSGKRPTVVNEMLG